MQQSLVSISLPTIIPAVLHHHLPPSYLQNVLHDVPDFEKRKKLLESLKNRLEALLSPKVIAAFNSHALGTLKSKYMLATVFLPLMAVLWFQWYGYVFSLYS